MSMNDLNLVMTTQSVNDFSVNDKEKAFVHVSSIISLFVIVESTQRRLLVCCRRENTISLISENPL